MPTPKSNVKVLYKKGKTEVKYENGCDATEYYIHELNRAALRDVAKFVKTKFKEGYYSHFHKRTGKGAKAYYSKVAASAKTEHPRVDMGLPHSHRGKAVEGYYSFFQEFGSSKTPRLGILQHAVEDNVAEIIKIESQYLSALEGEATRLESMIDEKDLEVDGENE